MSFLLVLLALAAACQPEEDAGTGELELRMAALINLEREARGLAPLSFSPALSDAARAYSSRMALAGEIHHELDESVEERIRSALPETCTFGENVAKHTSIDYSIGDLLMSPGHRANLLSPQFTEIGIGVVRGEDGFLYITQEFARPCEKRPARRPR